jgi:hypothetical protein
MIHNNSILIYGNVTPNYYFLQFVCFYVVQIYDEHIYFGLTTYSIRPINVNDKWGLKCLMNL